MIYITGDTHGEFDKRFNNKIFPIQKTMTKNDFLIICGDFGGIWNANGETSQEKYWLGWFETRNYTLLFIDGNHENFTRLNAYPVKKWHGGKVHEIRPSILHLMRGQIFNIDGKKIFTFGSAQSHDIGTKILEPDDPHLAQRKKELTHQYGFYRMHHVTWWDEETATQEEMNEGIENLKRVNNKVDYIITHCCATNLQKKLDVSTVKKQTTAMTNYLQKLEVLSDYKHWYFGHYHINKSIDAKHTVLYNDIIKI